MLNEDEYSKGVHYIFDLLKTNNYFFTLIDVGVSEGIDPFWEVFGTQLIAHGIDPLTTEIERLTQKNKNSNIYFYNHWIMLDNHSNDAMDSLTCHVFNLSSAAQASKILNSNYIQEHFNHHAPLKYTETKTSLDNLVADNNINNVDFIKIDTDGFDFNVIQSAEKLLASHEVLGIKIECQFHGTPNAASNTFANIDNFLRQQGFILFDIDTWRYSRYGLPQKFLYDLTGQTVKGQVLSGDALYFRDPLTHPELFESYRQQPEKLFKLLGLYAGFGLNDCAATLALKMQEKGITDNHFHYHDFLNLLVPENTFGGHDYQSYIQKFNQDPRGFYPSKLKTPTEPMMEFALKKIKYSIKKFIRLIKS